jgi:DHA2 family multidrug resistance protein-like MFS transporter
MTGVAALASLGTVVYRHELPDSIPAGIPAGTADAARESVTAAASAAGQLPGPLGHGLLDAGGTAFAGGLNAVAGVGAAVFVILAVLAAAALRHVPPTGHTPAEAGSVAGEPDPALTGPGWSGDCRYRYLIPPERHVRSVPCRSSAPGAGCSYSRSAA